LIIHPASCLCRCCATGAVPSGGLAIQAVSWGQLASQNPQAGLVTANVTKERRLDQRRCQQRQTHGSLLGRGRHLGTRLTLPCKLQAKTAWNSALSPFATLWSLHNRTLLSPLALQPGSFVYLQALTKYLLCRWSGPRRDRVGIYKPADNNSKSTQL